jgi:hypothetical protein
VNKELFDPPAIVKPADALAELAGRINAEHHQVEQALRAGLQHAKNAGDLLIEAKEQCRHGEWLPWLKANVHFSTRTAQAYMQVAKRWPELVAKAQGLAHLTFEDGLRLLAEPKEADCKSDTVSDLDAARWGGAEEDALPAGVAHYLAEGLIDREAARHLLAILDDYGPEIITPFKNPLPFEPEELSSEEAWFILNWLRPLDCPSLWPVTLNSKCHATPEVQRGVRVFAADVAARQGRGEGIPQWEVTAFWFASQIVQLAAALKAENKPVTVTMTEVLAGHLRQWRESFRTALIWMVLAGYPNKLDPAADKETKKLWWGYHSDLRHAGVLDQARGLGDEFLTGADEPRYPALTESAREGGRVMMEQGWCVLPSCMEYKERHGAA